MSASNIGNRAYTAGNPYQGAYKRVLCVCSAGLLRSPTAALVLAAEPFNFNTRSAGAEDSYALIPVDAVLIGWAQEIVCMTYQHEVMIREKFAEAVLPSIKVLNIPDNFAYRDPMLMAMIKENYTKLIA